MAVIVILDVLPTIKSVTTLALLTILPVADTIPPVFRLPTLALPETDTLVSVPTLVIFG